MRRAVDSLHAAASMATSVHVPVTAIDEEARTVSATIAVGSSSAASEWGQVFGVSPGTLGYDASRGRQFRDQPTPVLALLVAHGETAAASAYARALTDLASAACELGDPELATINAAGFVASAQLRALQGATARRGPPAGRDLLPHFARPVDVDPSQVPVAAGQTVAAQPPAAVAAPVEPQPTLDELLAQLDRLVGLDRVKEEIRQQTELLRISAKRRAAGLKEPDVTKHLVFVGNPGTGKSTVARLVAGIYRAVGILEKGQLVETDRAGLIAGYVGQTAPKVQEAVTSALGGVLFIDEAYSLVGDEYADEAVATLVKAMEDHRDDLVLIVAGYPDPMRRFIDSNPGFKSRFRLTIEFDDYTDDQLVEIFQRQCADNDFTPTEPCIAGLRALLARTPHDEGFGNARFVRNVFEAAVVRQAWRLRDVPDPTVDELRELRPEDLAEPVAPPAAAPAPASASPPAPDRARA
jgi:hypothetical protein